MVTAHHPMARVGGKNGESHQLLVEPQHRLHAGAIRTAIASRASRFNAGQAVSELDVLVELAVEINAIDPFDFFIDDRGERASAPRTFLPPSIGGQTR